MQYFEEVFGCLKAVYIFFFFNVFCFCRYDLQSSPFQFTHLNSPGGSPCAGHDGDIDEYNVDLQEELVSVRF